MIEVKLFKALNELLTARFMKKRKNKYLNLHKFVNQSDSFAEKYITNKGSRPVVIGQQNREISEFVFFVKTCSEEHKRLNILSLCLQFTTTTTKNVIVFKDNV